MAANNARNDETSAALLHRIKPFLDKYSVVSEIAQPIGIPANTLRNNLKYLADKGYMTVSKFNMRWYMQLTALGESVMKKYPLSLDLKKEKVEATPVVAVESDQTLAHARLAQAPYAELRNLQVMLNVVMSTLTYIDGALQACSPQMRTALHQCVLQSDSERQVIELLMVRKEEQYKSRKVKIQVQSVE